MSEKSNISHNSFIKSRFLLMLSTILDVLDAVRDANIRAEFSGLTLKASELEKEIGCLEKEIEDECLKKFCSGLEEHELIFPLAVFRSLGSLERIGDYAFSIATDFEKLAPRAKSTILQDVMPLIRLLSKMIELLAFAFSENDLSALNEVMRLDFEQVDSLYEQMQRSSLTRLMERPEDTEIAIAATRMGRKLERIGDHIVSVAERIKSLVIHTP